MLSRLRSFLTAWTRRERFEDALDDEVRFHLEACTEELVRSGIPRREAARRARVQFGSIEGAKDDCRRARGLRLADELEQIMTNTRLALRMLLKTPLVTSVAIVSLAMGIGAPRSSRSSARYCCVRCRSPRRNGLSTSRPRDPSRGRPAATAPARATRSSATRCSAIWSGNRRSSPTWPPTARSPSTSPIRTADGQRPGRADLRVVLPGAGPSARGRAALRSRGRRAHRRPSDRGPQP